ncbi:unnamed protein product [Allacma fusca]|uniref:Uncharacterized protein n=1 Tax=Allacma fusca TaxID=39272 RepID=A0A8J2JKF1_9HEXA|nr:unnamed protein product [Allacma fusca]
MICGRKAYLAIKSDANILRYEKYMAIEHANGRDVGDTNHGSNLCSKFASCLYRCLKQRMETDLLTPLPGTGRAAPVSVIADKYTPRRSTAQVIGLLSEYPLDIYILINKITKTCKFIDKFAWVLGFALDGEYFQKTVHNKLLGTSGLGYAPDGCNWVTCQWDPAHQIELCVGTALFGSTKNLPRNTVRPNNANDICYIFGIISSINASYSYVKRFGEIKEDAGGNFRIPDSFSTTRFAAYNLRVLLNFRHNYEYFYESLDAYNDDDLAAIQTSSYANCELLIAFNETLNDFYVNPNSLRYREKPLLLKRQVTTTRQDVGEHLARISKSKPGLMIIIEESFRLDKILNAHSSNVIPSEFLTYEQLARKFGHVYSHVSETEIKRQYQVMATLIFDLCDKYQNKFDRDKPWELESYVYCLLVGSTNTGNIEDVVHLLFTAMVRTHCESAAKSIGSVIGRHSQGRALCHENLRNESFID